MVDLHPHFAFKLVYMRFMSELVHAIYSGNNLHTHVMLRYLPLWVGWLKPQLFGEKFVIFLTLRSSIRRSEYPVKRQDSKEFRPGCFPVPTAFGMGARQLLVPK